MKKIFKSLFLAGVAALLATSCYRVEIDDLKDKTAFLQNEIPVIELQIQYINESIGDLEEMDAKLGAYIVDLQKDGELYAQQIADLQEMDETIKGQISDLKDYVDGEIQSTKDWTSATFATLKRFDSLCVVVAKIPSSIKDVEEKIGTAKTEITQAYTKAITDATGALETSMKKWVGEQFADYYTIAQVDDKLGDLKKGYEDADAELLKAINEQKEDLKKAKEEIKKAYEDAIMNAIKESEGKINDKIEKDIASAKGDLQGQIDAINNEITSIKGRLDKAEADIEALLKSIQSVVVIPTYNDGSVLVTSATTTINFEIKPASAASALATAWTSAGSKEQAKMISLTIKKALTKTLAPKSPSASVTEVTGNEKGELSVTVALADLPETAMASLQIASEKTDIASDYFELYWNHDYLCFTALEENATVALVKKKSPFDKYEYSTDKLNWKDITLALSTDQQKTAFATLANAGDKVYVRAKETRTKVQDRENLVCFDSSKQVEISGNIMYMATPSDPKYYTLQGFDFYSLFSSCSIVKADGLVLPATTLAEYCYNSMFGNCSSLVSAPELPATTLADNCYNSMFRDCSSLVSAPKLPATTLATFCYSYMFYNCSSLVSAPELPATTLAKNCYNCMFYNCSSLVSAPELPAMTLVEKCYYKMFYSCSKISSVEMYATGGFDTTNPLTEWLKNCAATGTVYVSNIMAVKYVNEFLPNKDLKIIPLEEPF